MSRLERNEIAPGVYRRDILKFATLAEAIEAANDSSRKYRVNVVLGNPTDSKPFWVPTTPRIGELLVKNGYENA